jgi:hypothetical protein
LERRDSPHFEERPANRGLGAIDAYRLGDGLDDWRYVVTIDGEERPDLDVRSVDAPGEPGSLPPRREP